jgi:iron complex outermembrane recepter protein
MMKIEGLIVALILCTIANAQNTLKGKVLNENAEHIPQATLTLVIKGKTIKQVTNTNGAFSFSNLPNGNYEVLISCVGYSSLNELVELKNENKTKNFNLVSTASQLKEVEVVGRLAKNYTSDYSFSATKIAIANKDLSQSISTITKELIADRQAFQLADAVKIASGVIPSSFYNQYAIRGISQNEEGQIINGLRTRQYYFIQPITSHIERIEVLKGPASVSFSSVDPGGSINLVTKKPLTENRKEVSVSAGSFNTIRTTLDFTGPLNKEKTLLYRLNGAYQEAKSYRDLVRNNSYLISPSISYVPNNKTSINVEMIISDMNGNLDRGQPIFGAVAGVTNLNSTPISLNLGASNDFFRSKEFIVTSTLNHKFSKQISFNVAYMKQTWTEDLQEHRTTNAFAVNINNQPVNNLAAMQFVQRKQFWNIDNINAYFNFDFKIGKATNKLVVGYDGSSWEKTKGGGQNAARGFLLNNGTVANSFVLANAANYQTIIVNGVTLPRPNVPHFDISNPQYTIRNVNDYVMNVRTALPAALTNNNSIYIQNLWQYNKFTVLLSLRQEWFKDITNYNAPNTNSFTNTAIIPRIGVTYAVNKNMNVYGTFLQGFQPQSNTVTLMPNTGSFFNTAKSAAQFQPLRSDLKELGVKASLFKGKISVTSSIYEINQSNLLMNANVPAFPDSLVTRGAERSRGFELDVAGYILPNWQVTGSYSYIEAIIVADNDATLIGARKQNTPQNSFNVFTRYNFNTNTALKDIGIGVGLQHNGSRIPWFVRSFEVPAFTVLDVAFYYKPVASNIQLAINVNNFLNTEYWIGAQNYLRLFPGAPRNIMFTATYKF